MNPNITSEEEALKAIAEGAEVITIDGKELLKDAGIVVTDDKQPKKRGFMVRVVVEVGQQRHDGNMDIVTSENFLGVSEDVKPSKLMEKIKPQVIDTLNKARAHHPNPLAQAKKSEIK